MLITKHFVFVHLQKTGGNFVKAVCEQHLPPDWLVPNDLDDHTSFHRIPAEHSHLPVFSLIRNPWDWYVSWYHFAVQSPQGERDEEPDSLWVRLFDRGGRDFRAAVTAACEGSSATPAPPPRWMQALRERDWDLYTLWYWQLAGRGVEEGSGGGGPRRDSSRGLHRVPGALRGAGRRSRSWTRCAPCRRRTPATAASIASTTTTNYETSSRTRRG